MGLPSFTVAGDVPDEQDVPPAETPLADDTAPAVARRPASLSSLKTEIARAMLVAADAERERIDAGVGEEETGQVEKIFARAAAEAAELSKHADEDVSLVDEWYEDQVKRIREEADRRIEDRRTGLEQSLTHHGSLIEAEVESVHVAVQGYRASLSAFFDRLAEERDPSGIARLAGTLPEPPDLDEIAAEARSRAMQSLTHGSAADTPEPSDDSSAHGDGGTGAEREPVPVMDPDAIAEPAGALRGAAIVATSAADPADDPSSSPVRSEVDASAPSEVLSSQGNVAVRVIRAFTSRTSATGVPEDQ